MSDLPSALGIEAVELVAEGGRTVTVRVTGRWRRRRPELRGQAMLVVETGTVRQRFVAMPEPPSLSGAAPGTWRMSFTVPAELAPQLPGKTFLQLGAVMVPLPVGEVPAPAGDVAAPVGEALEHEVAEGVEEGGEGETPGLGLLEARRLRSSELAAESARRRAAEAEAAVTELRARVEQIEGELDAARAESDRLQDVISERERRLRTSEQHAHAERALRGEVEQALAAKTRATGHDLRVLHDHVANLERELRRMRRTVDEAQHLAAAAAAARADAERRLAERPPPEAEADPAPAPALAEPTPELAAPSLPAPEPAAPSPPPPTVDIVRARLIAAELERARAAPARSPAPAPAAGPPIAPVRDADRVALGLELAMVERHPRRADAELRAMALERELADARREVADARREVGGERAELAGARRELERQRLLCERAYDAIARVRGELAQIGAGPPAEPAARVATPSEPVQADKLSAALARLRDGTPPAPAEEAPAIRATPQSGSPARPERPAKPWLRKVFRTLAARDPSSAGRLLLALLPAQRAADPHPVAYDLVLGDLATARVTVSSATAQVDLGDAPRPLSEVDFQVVGDLASIARLLAAGPVRRRLGRLALRHPVARIRGDRSRFPALEHLIDAPLTVAQLRAAGVRLDPVLALTLAALMVEPEWTVGERFTIAHREPPAPAPDAYLHVRDGKPLLPSAEPPYGPLASVLVCAGDEVLDALAGETPAQLDGDERPLALVRQWLDRAQSG